MILKLPHNSQNNDAIDGIRAIAVIFVLLFHAGTPLFGFGWIGVDIFFVMSGFLITSLLCKEYDRTKNINLKNFMMRRLLRIMPAYWVYASFVTILFFLGFGSFNNDSEWTGAWLIMSIWGYFNNFLPRGGIWEHSHLVIHLWSLSVEEQFYFIWPLLLLASLKFNRPLSVCALLCTLMFISRYFHTGVGQNYLLHTRGIGLGLGCLAAISITLEKYRSKPIYWLSQQRVHIVIYSLNAFGLLTLVILTQFGGIAPSTLRREIVPWLGIAFSLLIALIWIHPDSIFSRYLSWKPVKFIGRISYGIYLYHMLAWFLVWHVLLDGIDYWPRFPKFAIRLVSYISLSIAIAAFSYYVLERPLIRLKEKFRT
jgi:peptidoglycan/LPS O-acetylase OafA/YrhL